MREAEINRQRRDEMTPLEHAIKSEAHAIFELLARRERGPFIRPRYLDRALRQGFPNLLLDSGVDLSAMLISACRLDQLDSMTIILRHMPPIEALDIVLTSRYSNSSISVKVLDSGKFTRGEWEAFESRLRKEGARSWADFLEAAWRHDPVTLKLLLDQESSNGQCKRMVNAKTLDGNSAFHLAVKKSMMPQLMAVYPESYLRLDATLHVLFDHGAIIEGYLDGRTPLHITSHFTTPEVFLRILRKVLKQDHDQFDERDGKTVLQCEEKVAVYRYEQLRVIHTLLKRGANPILEVHKGKTALEFFNSVWVDKPEAVPVWEWSRVVRSYLQGWEEYDRDPQYNKPPYDLSGVDYLITYCKGFKKEP
ncbi:hypothetical protein BU16DRAFT_595444 [Lophium mytilinum]|uniref:Ankyrin n=1 Tax=Lophium mytilinum TaxID=390894 RepID=A0A6A6QHC7_9PEZI|nr:hypothetical protein BU16DRAFT_595444 [Lophium mytilinum]